MNIFRKNLKLIIFLGVILLFFIILKLLPVPAKPVPEIPSTTPTPFPTSLPASQNTPVPFVTDDPKIREFYEKLEEETYKGFPLFDYTPYNTEKWKITYIKSLNLVVTLKKDTPEIRQEVLDWISSKGVNPETHKIIWKTP